MDNLTVSGLKTALTVLAGCMAQEVSGTPWHHQGLRVCIGDGKTRETKLVAVRAGQTTTVWIKHPVPARQNCQFFLPARDIRELLAACRSEPDAPVIIRQSRQPIIKYPAVQFVMGEWYEAFLGSLQDNPLPLVSVDCRMRAATPQEVEAADSALTPLSAINPRSGQVCAVTPHPTRAGTVLQLAKPIRGIQAVTTQLY